VRDAGKSLHCLGILMWQLHKSFLPCRKATAFGKRGKVYGNVQAIRLKLPQKTQWDMNVDWIHLV
jgi:hypothetical protein